MAVYELIIIAFLMVHFVFVAVKGERLIILKW